MQKTLKILQYNTDNFRYGFDYLVPLVRDVDLLFLQRVPKEQKSPLSVLSGYRVFMLESCPPSGACLAIARTTQRLWFDDVEAIVLPSHDSVSAYPDTWQGCTALKVVVNDVNFVNVLPAHEKKDADGNIVISDFLRKADVEFLLKRFEDEPTVIIGDFHVKPNAEGTNSTLAKYDFKSYIDEAKSFKCGEGKPAFNLDKCVSNIDITVDNIKVHTTPTDRGHFAITYDMHLPNLDK